MRKLKIGILIESFPRISETWLVNQLIDLMDRGHEIRIFSIYPCPDSIVHQAVLKNQLLECTQYFFNSKSSRIKRITKGLAFSFSNIQNTNLVKFKKGIFAVLKGEVKLLFCFNYIFLKGMDDLDIFHAHFGEMGVFGAKMKKAGLLNKTKLIVSFHGHDIFPSNKKVFQREYQIFKEFADALIVNTPYSKVLLDDIISFHQVKLIPVGLDCEYFSPKGKQIHSDFTILFVGRLVLWKGPHIAIEIFKNLSVNNIDIQLILIGDGDLKEDIEDKIFEYNLKDRVKFLGALNQDEIIRYLDSSALFLYPAIYDKSVGAADTQGLVIQEAQAMALPVVSSDVGGIKYGLIEGETGFLVKEGDIDGFVERIQFLIDHPEERVKMGNAGRSFVKQKFDSKVIGDQLEKIYDETLQSN